MTLRVLTLFCTILYAGALSAQPTSEQRDLQKWLRNKDKPVIREIVVSGNKVIKTGEITKRMYSRTKTFLRSLQSDRRTRVQKESLNRDTLEIQFLYLSRGFINSRVSVSYEPIDPDSSARVRVTIVEGTQFRLKGVAITGGVDDEIHSTLDKLTEKFSAGKELNLPLVRQTAFDMKTVMANSGYPYASVTHHLDTTDGASLCRVTFHVNSDSLVHFGQTAVEGSDRFPEKAALRELTFKRGDIYRREALIESQSRLFEAGYFNSAQLSQNTFSGDRLNPDLVVRVRERKTRYATIRTGAGQSEVRDLQWDMSAIFGKRNFFGTRRLTAQAGYSFSFGQDSRLIDHFYRLSFTEPWFLGFRQPLTISGEFKPRLQSTVQDYDLQSWSVSASTTRKFSREFSASGGLVYRAVEISGVPKDLEEEIRREAGVSVRRNMYVDARRDSRDDLFVPRRGSYGVITANYYGGFLGGDENFVKIEASWSSYQVVWPGWISATRLKGGWARPFGQSKDVPSLDRLYLGGANSVRGFRENSLGPLGDDGSALGAEVVLVFNQEFRWRTVQIFQPIPFIKELFRNIPLWQSAFVDVGNGFADSREVKFRDMAVSFGTGVQLLSPAGPIRVDYGRVVKTERFSFDDRWHFTILYAF
jgi:outer membrane protein insertion porin family